MLARPGLRSLSATTGFFALALAFAGSVHGTNLVANGGFETGNFDFWRPFGETAFNGVQCPGPGDDTVAEGSCSAFFGPVDATGGIEQLVSLAVGKPYTLSFAFRPDGGVPSFFSASLGDQFLLELTDPPASAFQRFTFTFVASLPVEPLTFTFRDDAGFLFLDAVSLAVPEPTSVALLGIGLAALLAAFRRKSG